MQYKNYVARTHGFCKKPQPGVIDDDQVKLWAEAIRVLVINRRKALGLNQQDVADLVGVSRVTISAFESKTPGGDIGFSKILRMCLLLNIDIFAEAPNEYLDSRYYELSDKLRDLAYNFG